MYMSNRVKGMGAAALAIALAAGGAVAQGEIPQATDTYPMITFEYEAEIHSGIIRNEGTEPAVVFSTELGGTADDWIRLRFERVKLAGDIRDGTGSYLRITSLEDGAVQYLDAVGLSNWSGTSAYFNGDSVRIELIAFPGTGDNELVISEYTAGTYANVIESICGSVDDRTVSDDARSGRLWPTGCSVWLIDDCAKCMLTAGHCNPNGSDVVEFNVPLSSSSGTPQHPGPEDQYPVEVASIQDQVGSFSPGNDWAYFGTEINSNTGLSAFEAQGASYTLTTTLPNVDDPVRVTGFGSTGSGVDPRLNLAQKTHVGPFVELSGSATYEIRYRPDTSGGNSGSAVENELTGEAFGIHGYAGCNSIGGNGGTSLAHPDIQNALANPIGVCECPGLVLDLLSDAPLSLNPAGGDTVELSIAPSEPGGPTLEPGTAVMTLETTAGASVDIPLEDLGNGNFQATFPSEACGSGANFYFSARDTSGETHTLPFGAPSQTFTAPYADDLLVAADYDFETDVAWDIVNSSLTTGAWELAVPVNAGRGDPSADADGSGRAWVTDNGFNADVDGGPTRLVTEAFDLSSSPEAVISYAYWWSTNNEDSTDFTVEISNDDGATWVLVDDPTGADSWRNMEFSVASFVSPTDSVRLRFSASDNPNDSIAEAAIDAFSITAVVCNDCPADLTGPNGEPDGVVDADDFFSYLQLFADQSPDADLTGPGGSPDGILDADDFFFYLDAFSQGCG